MGVQKREQWSHRFGYLMAVAGAMVGAGNIWRLPYVTGENGGGAFLVAYFVLLYLIAVPGLMAETGLGRYTRRGVIGTFRSVYDNSKFVGLGLAIVVFNIVLMSYYSSVVGWSIYYAAHAVIGTFTQPDLDSGALWAHFSASPVLQVSMHTLSMLILTGILVMGITGGIERAAKYMMPFLFVSLVAITIRGLTLPGAMAGLEFSFSPDWTYLVKGSTWLAALGQALFSTGLGWGIALTLGSYLGRDDDIPLGGGIFTAVGNTSFGLLAIFAVFPIVFAFGMSPSSGSQLAFVALANAFGSMPGGYFWALLFFVSFLFANVTTAIAITEVGVTTYREERDTARTPAVLAICAVIWLLGLPSAIDTAVLGYLDFVVGNWGLPLATLFVMITAGWKFDAHRLRVLSINRGANVYVPRIWEGFIRYAIPLIMLGIMVVYFFNSFHETPWKTLSGIIALALILFASLAIMSQVERNKLRSATTRGQRS